MERNQGGSLNYQSIHCYNQMEKILFMREEGTTDEYIAITLLKDIMLNEQGRISFSMNA